MQADGQPSRPMLMPRLLRLLGRAQWRSSNGSFSLASFDYCCTLQHPSLMHARLSACCCHSMSLSCTHAHRHSYTHTCKHTQVNLSCFLSRTLLVAGRFFLRSRFPNQFVLKNSTRVFRFISTLRALSCSTRDLTYIIF